MPASLHTKKVLILSTALLTSLVLATTFIKPESDNKKVLGAEADNNELLKQKQFWEQIVITHPTYRDGWLALAKIESEIGNMEFARLWFSYAQRIDPNSQQVISLGKELGL